MLKCDIVIYGWQRGILKSSRGSGGVGCGGGGWRVFEVGWRGVKSLGRSSHGGLFFSYTQHGVE